MCKNKGNYFVVIQLDEVEFPSRARKTYKYRTEVIPLATTPKFIRNVFTFQNISLGSRITVKVGLFDSKLNDDNPDAKELLAHSNLVASNHVLMTQRKVTFLRENPYLEEGLILQDEHKQEFGRITLTLKFKPSTFEQQIDEDVRIVERIYYSPYENDPDVIAKKTKKVTQMLETKHNQLEDVMKKLDFVRNSFKSITTELAQLKIQKEKIEAENTKMKSALEKYTSLKELNIQIDLLKDTPQGIALLKEKFAKLLGKLNLERQVYEELSKEYFKIEAQLKEKKAIEKQIAEVKQASEEQSFHIKRVCDIMPQVKNHRESIKQQEDIIQNLQSIVKEHLKNADLMRDKEIKVNLKRLKYDRQVMTEKHKQLKLVLDMNEGEIPLDVFKKLQKDEYFRDDPREVQKYREHAEELLQEVEELTSGLQAVTTQEADFRRKAEEYDTPQVQFEKDIIVYQIETLDKKAETLEEEAINLARSNAKTLADLTQKLITLDALLLGTKHL